MGVEITPPTITAFGIPDPRLSFANLNPESGTAASDYTEADVVTGVPTAQETTTMALRGYGDPTDGGHLEIQTLRAGHAGNLRAGFGWRDVAGGDSTSQIKGHEGPQLITGWETLVWQTDGTLPDSYMHAIRLQTGEVMVAGTTGTSVGKTHNIELYDPADGSWTTTTVSQTDWQNQGGPTLVELPNKRVILYLETADGLQVDSWYSDDKGATWAVYARRVLPAALASGSTISRLHAAYSAGDVCLLVSYTSGGSRTLDQYGSDDLGQSFIAVDTDAISGEDPEGAEVHAGISGGFIVAYADNDGAGASNIYTRKIGSAFESVSDASAVAIASGLSAAALTPFTMFRDDDGTLYAIADTATNDFRAAVSKSTDEAESWSTFTLGQGLHTGSSANGAFKLFTGAVTFGRFMLITRWDATNATQDDQSVGVVYLGGYSTLTAPYQIGATDYTATQQVQYATDNSNSRFGGMYLPIIDPADLGATWNAAGTGTGALVSGSTWRITTSADTLFYNRTSADANLVAAWAEFELKVDSGSGDDTAAEIVAWVRLTDYDGTPASTTFNYSVQIRFDDAGLAVHDVNAGSDVGTVAVDMTTLRKVRLALDASGSVQVWYGVAGHTRTWTAGPTSTGLTKSTSDVPNLLQWGHINNTTGSSDWKMLGYCFWADRFGPAASKRIGAAWTNPDDLAPRTFPLLPTGIADGVKIAAHSGPTRVGDKWDVKPVGLRPMRNLWWEQSASPEEVWRSADETEHIFAWDIGTDGKTRMGGFSLFLMVLNSNFRTCYLESSSNGSAWTSRIAYDARIGYANLRFDRYGDIVRPDAGAAHQATRYIIDGDLIGGTFFDRANTKRRRIASNTSGAWTDKAGRKAQLTLNGIDGTEGTTGECEIWAPSGVGLVHDIDTDDRYWRVRIDAQTTANGYFEAGQIVVGHIEAHANPYSPGYTRIGRPSTDLYELPNGMTRATNRGSRVREFDFAWSEGVDEMPHQRASALPSYITGTTSGEPIASVGEAPTTVEALLRRQRGAARPIVWLGNVPTGSGTHMILSPRKFLWSRITAEAVSVDNIVGDEGESEMSRTGSVTLRELPGRDSL